jgi:molybdate transport system substrate-binding protein
MKIIVKKLSASRFHAATILAIGFLTACQPDSAKEDATAAPGSLIVFAAASTTNAVQELAKIYEAQTGVALVTSFASSSTLAKQIEAGAPASIFISANPKWMDYLESQGRVVVGTRANLLGNRIVLIAPAASGPQSVSITPMLDFEGLLEGRRLAMGDPVHVPAGIYGRQALENLGLWTSVAQQIAPMSDVRAALTIVERGETPFGVVYATDAALSEKVRVVGVFPDDSYPPIVYPAAMVAEMHAGAVQALLDFLRTPMAAAVFEKYGFSLAEEGFGAGLAE